MATEAKSFESLMARFCEIAPEIAAENGMAFDLATVQVDFVHATGGVMPFSVEERQQDSSMPGGVGRAGEKPALTRLGIAQLFDN